MRLWLKLAMAVTALLVVAGHAGVLHPLGDSLAVFRAQGVGALALLSCAAIAFRMWRAAGVGLALVLVAGGPLVLAYTVSGEGGALRLYQKNILFRNDDLDGLQADIRASGASAVTLQEVSVANQAMLADLSDLYPHRVLCPFSTVGGVAILTLLEPVAGASRCAKGMAALRVMGPEGPLWLVSVHLYWPWPHRQAEQLEQLLPVIAELEGPVVIAGDFNMVPWSAALAGVRAAARVQAAGPVRRSFARFGSLAVLPIDHVMAPHGGHLQTRPELGSDHRGLLADLWLETTK